MVPSPSESGWRGHARRPVVIGGIAAVLLVIGGATAWATGSSASSGYRMTTVVHTTVATSLDVVGTVEPVSDASASFQVAGKVVTVTAAVGDTVTAGQTLAVNLEVGFDDRRAHELHSPERVERKSGGDCPGSGHLGHRPAPRVDGPAARSGRPGPSPVHLWNERHPNVHPAPA